MKTDKEAFLGSLEAHLQLRNFIHGHKFSAVDVLVISAIRSSEENCELPARLSGLDSFGTYLCPSKSKH